MSKEFYAEVSWCVEDVKALCPKMTDDEAREWLENNEKYIRDRLVELGFEVIEDLM